MALIFQLETGLKHVPKIKEVGIETSPERYQFPARQKFITKYQHAELHAELEKKDKDYRKHKLLRIPFARQDVYSKYYTDGKFRYKGQLLELVDRQKEKRPSNTEVVAEFKKLKFNHDLDDAQEFINKFEQLTDGYLQANPSIIDETRAKMEFVRFFHLSDRLKFTRELANYKLKQLYAEFYGLYGQRAAEHRRHLEALSFTSARSLERFLREKLAYMVQFAGNPSLPAKKLQLLASLPDEIVEQIKIDQPSLNDIESVIQYILLRCEEVGYQQKAIRMKNETEAGAMQIFEEFENNANESDSYEELEYD